jgi:hypothetical protein
VNTGAKPAIPATCRFEQRDPILGEDHMARAASLARAHADSAGVGAEVTDAETDDLAISTPGQKRALHQRTEDGSAGVDEPLRLRVIEIANFRRASFTERLNPAPSLIACRMPLAEREVQRGLEHAQDTIGARPALTHGVGILKIDFADVPPFCGLAVHKRADASARAASHSGIIAGIKLSTS